MTDAPLGARLAAAAQGRQRQRYSLEATQRQLFDGYRELLAARGPGLDLRKTP